MRLSFERAVRVFRTAFRGSAVAALALLASACGDPRSVLPSGQQAYEIVPVGDVLQARDYVIGPLDELRITVFREPDLSSERATVDSDGLVQLPLIGQVPASGLTSVQLARAIEQRLSERYLVDPRVTVAVTTSSRRRVTVDGAVGAPGVYEMPGRLSLIDAVALARGMSPIARSTQVAIVRRVDGKRVGGVFDLGRIRAGMDPDPEVIAGDQVIVGTSAIKSAYRDLLMAAPLLGVLRPF